MIGAVLFRVPDVPIYRFKRFVYRNSPLVKHFQEIEGIFEFVGNVRLAEPVIIYSNTQSGDLPYEISEKTGRMLHSFLKSNDLRSPPDAENRLTTVTIDDGKFNFEYANAPNYRIPTDEAFKRFRMRKTGFLTEYYTMKGGTFLFLGFLLQFLGTLPA